jgi:hypothetical protein
VSTTPHTKAWMTLERNLDSISHMLDFAAREIATMKTLAARLNKTSIGDLTKKPERAKLVRSLGRYNATLRLRLDRFNTATLWQVVMLVTCIEVYLQNVVAAAASIDPEFMSKSKCGGLTHGGPAARISNLVKMGAEDYPLELAPRLQFIWGLRHVIVHSAGAADAAFLKWHPGAAKAVGDRVQVNNRQFREFLAAAFEFLEPTDRFFLVRYPSLRA